MLARLVLQKLLFVFLALFALFVALTQEALATGTLSSPRSFNVGHTVATYPLTDTTARQP